MMALPVFVLFVVIKAIFLLLNTNFFDKKQPLKVPYGLLVKYCSCVDRIRRITNTMLATHRYQPEAMINTMDKIALLRRATRFKESSV